MFSSISRLLRRLGIPFNSRSQVTALRVPPEDLHGPGLCKIMEGDAVGAQDDGGRDERKGEPAMEGILTDTLQRTPPVAASPGLPPVDPVTPDVIDGPPAPKRSRNRSTALRKEAPSRRRKNADLEVRDSLGNLS